jgi:6-phosphogluconolactonase (cycloisomerase 2 family)
VKPQSALWTSVFGGMALSLMLPGCGGGSSSSTKGCGNNCPPPAAAFLYVLESNPFAHPPEVVATLGVNPSTGGAGPATNNLIVPYGSLDIKATASGKFLYVSYAGTDSIYGYSVDPRNGSLVGIPGSPFSVGGIPHSGPYGMTVDPHGRFLYASNCPNDCAVFGFTINGDTGALTMMPGAPSPSGFGNFAAAVDPSGKFLYVDKIGSIAAFSIDPTSGVPTPLPASPFLLPPNCGEPADMAFHPSGKFMYAVTGCNNSTVTLVILMIVGADGSLVMPDQQFAVAGSTSWSAVVDPKGKFLYAAGLFEGSISTFAIDSASGVLTPVNGSPFHTGGQPYDVALDPSGQFLYASDILNNVVLSFSTSATGLLNPVGQPVSTDPMGPTWLVLVKEP